MADPSIKEIQEQEQQDAQPEDSDSPDPTETEAGDGGGMIDALPFALTPKQVGLIAVVVVGILVWQSRSSSSGAPDGQQQMRKAREGDFSTEVEATPTGDPGDADAPADEETDPEAVGRAVIPARPDNELEKDEAALRFLMERGKIGQSAGGAS